MGIYDSYRFCQERIAMLRFGGILKNLIMFVIVFASIMTLCVQMTETATQIYPPSSSVNEWKQEVLNGKISGLYYVSDRLKKLPREPWPEDWRSLLLYITQRHVAIRDSIREIKNVDFGDPKFKKSWLGEYVGNLVEMASYQGDSRFVPFLAEHLGSGKLAARGLAKIGEPAFDTVIEALYQDGWSTQPNAAYTLDLMLKQSNGFLDTDSLKRETAKQGLLHVARVNFMESKLRAMDALKHFAKSPEVVTLIDSIYRHDETNVDGRYFVREKAGDVLLAIQTDANK